MSFIKTIPYKEANGKLKRLYERVKGPNNNVDNVLKVHSLRPHTLNGHMVLYKSVLHHNGNTFAKAYLETLGTYVSKLNACDYCYQHHLQGIRRACNDDNLYQQIKAAIDTEDFKGVYDEKLLAGAEYAHKLTLHHTSIDRQYIEGLRGRGLNDGEILEINQLVSYFNYVNRMVVGLGVDIDGDIIGLSPGNNNDENDWGHE